MSTQKKKTKKSAVKTSQGSDTKFIMVTFGRGDEEIFDAVEKLADEMRWSRAALVREIIRKHFGYASHLN